MISETFCTSISLHTEDGTVELLAVFPETEFDLIAGYRHWLAENYFDDQYRDYDLMDFREEFDWIVENRYQLQDGFSIYTDESAA